MAPTASSSRTTAAVSWTARSRTIDALPDIAARVGGRVPVLLDGGVRRGTDVLKAVALGAAAVLIGRPYLWGLAAAGEAGRSTRARSSSWRTRAGDGLERLPASRRHRCARSSHCRSSIVESSKATMPWIQVYDPLGSPWLSTAAAALPIVLLLVALGRPRVARALGRARRARVGARRVGRRLRHAGRRPPRRRRSTAPPTACCRSAGSFVNAVFLYNLTVETGQFEIVKASVGQPVGATGASRRC